MFQSNLPNIINFFTFQWKSVLSFNLKIPEKHISGFGDLFSLRKTLTHAIKVGKARKLK